MSRSSHGDHLTPEQYHVLFEKGTEPPFSGQYVHTTRAGTYVCANCGHKLFASDNKYSSGCGWPSFDDIKNLDSVKTAPDLSHGMTRTEVLCANCGGHLGHVFPDGPTETTGQRYCINSLALDFKPVEDRD